MRIVLGNGTTTGDFHEYDPQPGVTGIINQVAETTQITARPRIDGTKITGIIPHGIGSFWVTEAGLVDGHSNEIMCVMTVPAMHHTEEGDGSAVSRAISFVLLHSNQMNVSVYTSGDQDVVTQDDLDALGGSLLEEAVQHKFTVPANVTTHFHPFPAGKTYPATRTILQSHSCHAPIGASSGTSGVVQGVTFSFRVAGENYTGIEVKRGPNGLFRDAFEAVVQVAKYGPRYIVGGDP